MPASCNKKTLPRLLLSYRPDVSVPAPMYPFFMQGL